MANKIGVIIPAAGSGRRLGGVSKPLIEIGGRPIIIRLIDLFADLRSVAIVCIAAPRDNIKLFEGIVSHSGHRDILRIVEGGTERPLSVKNAFVQLGQFLSDDDLVCIHDAARPLLSEEDLTRVVEAGWAHDAAFLGMRVKDTLKLAGSDGFCESTVDRSRIVAAQTPQVMKAGLLKKSYSEVSDLSGITDEIMLMERIGVRSFIVEPRHLNFKVTTSEDLDLLKKIIS